MYRLRMPNGRLVETSTILMVNTESDEYYTCAKEDADAIAFYTEGNENRCYLIQCTSHTNRILLTDINRQLWQNGCVKLSHHKFYVTPLSPETYHALADQTGDV